MTKQISSPLEPTNVYQGTLTDSRQWKRFKPRPGDVVVASPPKSGTTWTQGILALLISGDPEVDAKPSKNSPWFDTRFDDRSDVVAALDALKTLRHVKTHTPLDGVPIWDEVRYITVYRHPIDVHFSARNHVANYLPEIAKELGVDLEKFPADPRKSFRIFLDGFELDHGSLRTIVNHYRTCLALEPRENILRLHYADMKRDLAGTVRKIADHVGISHTPELMRSLVKAATFENMKSNAGSFGLAVGEGFWRDKASFFDTGSSNKWDDILIDSDMTAYDEAVSDLLDPNERYWLEWGSPS